MPNDDIWLFGHLRSKTEQRLIKIEAVVDLDNLHDAAEGEGEGDEDEQQGDEGQQVGADAGPLLAHCNSAVQYSTVQYSTLQYRALLHTDTVIGHFITTFIGAILVLLL